MNNSPEQFDYANSVPYYIPERKKYPYTLTHAFYALFAFVIGTLWYRWIMTYNSDGIFGNSRAVPVAAFTLVFFVFALSFFRLRGIKPGKDAFILMGACLVFSLRYVLYPKDVYSFMAFLSLLVLHVCVLLFLYCIGNKASLDRIVGSTFKSIFYAPFSCFHCIYVAFCAFFKSRKKTDDEKSRTKDWLYKFVLVLFGIAIATPILVNVLVLLSSDGFFADFLRGISDFFANISFEIRLGDYFNLITILVAMYIFGAVFSADKRVTLPEEAKDYSADFRIMPKIMGSTINISFLVVYALFFIAQIDGFSHMLAGSIPENTTYAEFARSGFFELCTVACINGAVLYFPDIMEVRDESKKSVSVTKILLIVFTLLLIFTAASKMILYISVYGFTPKRFYTLWFMLLLTVLFVMAIFKLRYREFRLSRYATYVTLLWLCVLFLVDFEGISSALNAEYFSLL